MALQALWLPPEPLPLPDPLPLPEPLPLPDPEPVPLDENVEPDVPPPQLAHENANASTPTAAGRFFHKTFMSLFSQEIVAKTARSQAMPGGIQDMYHQHLVGGLNWKLSTDLIKKAAGITGEIAIFNSNCKVDSAMPGQDSLLSGQVKPTSLGGPELLIGHF